MAYSKQTWNNNDSNTPLSATRLNHIEDGIAGVDNGLSSLSVVATSGSYNDLSNKPTLALVAASGSYNDLSDKPVLQTVATSGQYADLLNKPSLAAVATSGVYGDLTGQPTISDLGGVPSTRTVAGQPLSADVTLDKGSVGLASVDNTADNAKNVLSATKLSTARNIAIAGAVTGSASFDGSANVTLTVTQGDLSQTHTTSNTNPFWKTNYTSQDFNTEVLNTSEHYVSMKAGANTTTPNLASWTNEWGAIRGTSPYGSWGDALVRAIRVDDDGITNGTAAAVEVVDRRTGATAQTMWGRSWVDGGIIRNSQKPTETYTWTYGDADPTVGGTVDLPARVSWIIKLNTSADVPSWVPAGSTIVRS